MPEDGGSVSGERGVEQVELRERVDHDRDARLGSFGGETRKLAQRAPIGGRVGDEDVL